MIWERLRNAGLIAGAAFLSAAPYTYYVSTIAFSDRLKLLARNMSDEDLVRFDIAAMGAMVVIAALVGTFASERYGLAGLGDRDRFKRASPFFVVGIVLGMLSYFIYGVRLAAAVPGYYPKALGWAIAVMVKGAVFDEVIARYGMMTIVAGVVKKTWVANALTAIFFTAVGLRSMMFFGVHVALEPFVLGGLFASLGVHLVLGHVYARYGLFASCAVHLALEVERLIHVAMT